jgi:hypothetical protein
MQPGQFSSVNTPISDLTANLENLLQIPVIDQTGIANKSHQMQKTHHTTKQCFDRFRISKTLLSLFNLLHGSPTTPLKFNFDW